MKKKIKKLLKPIYLRWVILCDYYYDYRKFVSTSAEFNHLISKDSMEAAMTMKYHSIEKALSLPSPKYGFGQIMINQLLIETLQYYKKYGYNDFLKIVLDNLLTYVEFNRTNQITDLPILIKIEHLISKIEEFKKDKIKTGGTTLVKKTDIINTTNDFKFESFISQRYSIRDFSKTEVSLEKIKAAVKIALKAPSACNRQAWKVHFFNAKQKDKVLQYQNGNRGFTESINGVLLITGLTSSFFFYERIQALIDGGVFASYLMLALHSLGLGTCALNTSYSKKAELKLRRGIKLPNNEIPIMMLAVGELKDSFYIANSPRRSIDEVLEVYK